MKRIIFVLIMALCLIFLIPELSLPAEAENVSSLTFRDNSDGSGYIVARSYAEGELTIPGTHNGKPVTGIGAGAFSRCKKLTKVILPDSVHELQNSAFEYCYQLSEVVFGNGITQLYGEPFLSCTRLKTVHLPDSITRIDDSVFADCPVETVVATEGSKKVTSVMTLKNKNIKHFIVPDSVTQIEQSAFAYHNGLTTLDIGKGVTHIFDYAFFSCPNLAQVNITDLEAWCRISFTKGFGIPSNSANPLNNGGALYLNGSPLTELVIPNGITEIKGYAFVNCKTLTSVTIPDTVTAIGTGAFSGCAGLSHVTIPDSVITLGGGVFSFCTGLRTLKLPANITLVPANLCSDCIVLQGISIPGKVTEIGENAFKNCTSFATLELPLSTTKVDRNAFSGTTIQMFVVADGVTKIPSGYVMGDPKIVMIPGSVTAIMSGAFSTCTQLESVYVTDPSAWCKITFEGTDSNPMDKADRLHVVDKNGNELTEFTLDDSIQEIPAERFQNCKKPSKITLGANVAKIGQEAFRDCLNLKEIVFPKKLEEIQYGSFLGCTKLETIYFGGSRDDWEMVIIGNVNHSVESAKVVCAEASSCAHTYKSCFYLDGKGHWWKCIHCDAMSELEPHVPDGEPTQSRAQKCIYCSYIMKPPLGHTHNLENRWEVDATGHWKTCTGCYGRESYAAHVPSAETTQECAQVCTVCGYVIQPALGHTCEFDPYLSTDSQGHWHACYGCEERLEYAGHDFDNACDNDCSTCGYTRQTQHAFDDKWTSDAAKHWHTCIGCGLAQDEAPHEFSAGDDETTAQTCAVCYYVNAPSLGTNVTKPSDAPGNDVTQNQAPTEATGNGDLSEQPELEKNGFPWWIAVIGAVVGIVIAAGGGTVMFIIYKKKKK